MENRVLVPEIVELEMHGVADPGVPNRERIYLRAATEVELGKYFLVTGLLQEDGAAMPLTDYFWLSKAMKVAEGYWIIVYTGPGEQKMTKLETGEPCLVLHWGKKTVLFELPLIVPILIRVGAIEVGYQIRPDTPKLTK